MTSPARETEEPLPLHVRVARALGWTGIEPHESGWWLGLTSEFQDATRIPRYDTDWSAAGPLIEKYRITLASLGNGEWNASVPLSSGRHRSGNSPLEAVCNLLLALHAK